MDKLTQEWLEYMEASNLLFDWTTFAHDMLQRFNPIVLLDRDPKAARGSILFLIFLNYTIKYLKEKQIRQ